MLKAWSEYTHTVGGWGGCKPSRFRRRECPLSIQHLWVRDDPKLLDDGGEIPKSQ